MVLMSCLSGALFFLDEFGRKGQIKNIFLSHMGYDSHPCGVEAKMYGLYLKDAKSTQTREFG
jgi:hypothetical protein